MRWRTAIFQCTFRERVGVVWLRGWGGANGFEIAEACARVALCVSRGRVEEVTYDLHDEFWFWWWGGTSELRVVR